MATTTNIFELGTRKKLRFPFRGASTIEDLWDLSQEELNSIYIKLKESKKESGLLDAKENSENDEIELKMDIVKEIFRVNKEEIEARKTEMLKSQKRQEILDALQAKDSEELKGMSREELERKLQEL